MIGKKKTDIVYLNCYHCNKGFIREKEIAGLLGVNFCSADCFKKYEKELIEQYYDNKPFFKDSNGYIFVYIRKKGKYIPQHRWTWEKQNGVIQKGYVIHHINGIVDDNRIENLTLFENAKHLRYHRQLKKQELALMKLKWQI